MSRLIVKGELKKCYDCQTDKIIFKLILFEETTLFYFHEGKYYCPIHGEKHTKKVSCLDNFEIQVDK